MLGNHLIKKPMVRHQPPPCTQRVEGEAALQSGTNQERICCIYCSSEIRWLIKISCCRRTALWISEVAWRCVWSSLPSQVAHREVRSKASVISRFIVHLVLRFDSDINVQAARSLPFFKCLHISRELQTVACGQLSTFFPFNLISMKNGLWAHVTRPFIPKSYVL